MIFVTTIMHVRLTGNYVLRMNRDSRATALARAGAGRQQQRQNRKDLCIAEQHLQNIVSAFIPRSTRMPKPRGESSSFADTVPGHKPHNPQSPLNIARSSADSPDRPNSLPECLAS
jgi:hypothetical protein